MLRTITLIVGLVLFAAIAVTPARAGYVGGDLYVSSRLGPSIAYVGPSGGAVTPFVTGMDTTGLTFGPDGTLYAAFTANSSPTGLIYKVTPAGVVSTFATGLSGPSHIAFGPDGDLYVTQAAANIVSKISPSGVVSTLAAITFPTGLAFDRSGNLYVSSETGDFVDKITPGGVVSTFATGFDIPEGLAFDTSGNLYVANNRYTHNADGYISMVTPGGVVSTFATGFNSPQGLLFDSGGNLYVGEYYPGTVSRVGPTGGTATLFATGITGAESLDFAPGVSSVPAPPSLVLALTGLCLLAWRRLRRNRN
jgi:sugar lactone lactonase YvrE